ncbi:MAG: aldehyde dehydrogenase family protein [Chloroflexi bacterium]|nr:aldehyde dehydrogenase family protein [Chloroflexota bacterium]
MQQKLTYATLSADSDELHVAMDEALERIQSQLGKTYPLWINGEPRVAEETFASFTPIDTREPINHFSFASTEDVNEAVAAAKAAFPAWARTPWQDRVAMIRRIVDVLNERKFDLAAAMIMDTGKNRLEALGEVGETIDIYSYYADKMEEDAGYVYEMKSETGRDRNRSVFKPYGVWGIISPFNFPFALAAAPICAAILTGNTVVIKPGEDAPWVIVMLTEWFHEIGLPAGVLNTVTGNGRTAGAAIINHPDTAGMTFTGSYNVGYNIVYKGFAKDYPKPAIIEMGGKNPVIVSDKADIDKAASGVMRGAFGLGGQKCSATSRVYVHEAVYDTFMDRLLAMTEEKVTIGDPRERGTFLGPVINDEAYTKYQDAIEKARRDGKVVYGGDVVTEGEFAHGYFVQPAIMTDLGEEHELVRNELFLPILYVNKVTSLDQAMDYANDTEFGLTAGIFSEDQTELDWFLDNIEAGVVYANREGGATTGAWPHHQTFGGWKGSGSTGTNIFGEFSLISYLREQSQTIYRD